MLYFQSETEYLVTHVLQSVDVLTFLFQSEQRWVWPVQALSLTSSSVISVTVRMSGCISLTMHR